MSLRLKIYFLTKPQNFGGSRAWDMSWADMVTSTLWQLHSCFALLKISNYCNKWGLTASKIIFIPLLICIFWQKIFEKFNWNRDVARPLSYKTKNTYFFKTGQAKTAFSRPRPLFLKTIKLLTQDRWHSQKFWLGGVQIRKNFVTLFWWHFSVM